MALLSMRWLRFCAAHKRQLMYTLIRSITTPRLFAQQLPALTVSFVLAELFYKFHSFTLECLAFLATWSLLDMMLAILIAKLKRWRWAGRIFAD
jgi:hypothetical protein